MGREGENYMDKQAYLAQIDRVIAAGPYKADWGSLSRHATPGWYQDAKLGIFIHWGIYSVPGYHNEWYSREMYDPKTPSYRYHVAHYGKPDQFGYKDFIPMFKGEKFDPAAWARLFCAAGAQYVMPVAEHHDGFAMYQTDFNRWNSVEMGPHQDVLGRLKSACQGEGLVFCASNHRAEHYFFMNNGRRIPSDVSDPAYGDFYGPAKDSNALLSYKMSATANDCRTEGPTEDYLEDWLVRCCEMVDRYRPQVVYFDWWIHNLAFKPYLKRFAAYYYNQAEAWGVQVDINYKLQAFAPCCAMPDVERGALTEVSPVPWQTCTAIGKRSWGYTKDNRFKSPYHVITDLIDIVSKNGRMLLNVGPKPDGTITKEETRVLQSLGDWLAVNGKGIYGTMPWRCYGEGKVRVKAGFFQDNKAKKYTPRDFRFTYKDGRIYAFQMLPGKNKTVRLRTFCTTAQDLDIRRVTWLGVGEVPFTRSAKHLELQLPKTPGTLLPLCFELEIG